MRLLCLTKAYITHEQLPIKVFDSIITHKLRIEFGYEIKWRKLNEGSGMVAYDKVRKGKGSGWGKVAFNKVRKGKGKGWIKVA